MISPVLKDQETFQQAFYSSYQKAKNLPYTELKAMKFGIIMQAERCTSSHLMKMAWNRDIH